MAIFMLAARVWADVAGPTNAPVDRLIANITTALADKPNDADLHYRLARVHAMAFALNATSLRAYEHQRGVPDLANLDLQSKPSATPLPGDSREQHVLKAVEHFDRAILLDPDRAQYYLGFGWLLEAAGDLAGKAGINPAPPHAPAPSAQVQADLTKDVSKLPDAAIEQRLRIRLGLDCSGMSSFMQSHPMNRVLVGALVASWNDPDQARSESIARLLKLDWEMQAEHRYFQAFARSLDAEAYDAVQPMFNGVRSGINYEAATAYLRLVEKRGPGKCDGVRVATARAAVKAYDKLPMAGAVSPVIFPINGAESLASITNDAACVRFDLDGTGRLQDYSWLASDAGVLVWDPVNSGKITSGRQLFGSVSWWIFFANGYEALDALDDNRDGELTGAELKGIAVWVDRNGNGISDPGEVIAIEKFGVRSIRVRATSTEDGCPANREGLVMADGRVLPTYDWIARPAQEPTPAPDPVALRTMPTP